MGPSYNNSFGSFGSSGPNFGMSVSGPISSGNGELVLPAAPEKKSKKLLLVVVIFLFVIALAIGLISMAMPSDQSGGEDSSAKAKNYQEAFNLYTNYYLYGEAKTDEVAAEYKEEQDSYFNKMTDSGEINKEYLKNLKDYYAKFLELYDEDLKDYGYYDQVVDSYKTKLDLLSAYYGGAYISMEAIAKTYSSGGETAAREYIDEKIEPYKDLGQIYDLNYYGTISEWGNEALELIGQYNKLGCLNDGWVDYDCVSNKSNELSSNNFSKLDQQVRMILDNSRKDLYVDVFIINSYIDEEVDDAEE